MATPVYMCVAVFRNENEISKELIPINLEKTVGDIVFEVIGDINVRVSGVYASENCRSDRGGAEVKMSTPANVLQQFPWRFLQVFTTTEDAPKPSSEKNAFSVLLECQRSYTKLPPKK